jgi:hypothetical protein
MKMAPSLQLIFSLERKYQKNKLVIIENITRFRKTSTFMMTDEPTRAGKESVIPKIKVMLTKLLPIMFQVLDQDNLLNKLSSQLIFLEGSCRRQ